MKGQGARFEEAGFLMVESCLMVGDGLFFCGSFFRALSQPHTMLFALVPLNELSSSFTRIDGTVFDGTPSEFRCLTCVGSAPCPLLHGAGPTGHSQPLGSGTGRGARREAPGVRRVHRWR